MTETSNKSHKSIYELVVVGASAGGIEALSTLVRTLPTDFPIPIVLAQHLDPSRPSRLGLILERCTSTPIVVVEGSCRLQAGHIYVIPANQHVAINDGKVELIDDHQERPKPSLDLLLSTAAKAYGENLIAIILTGSGNDGTAGAVDVKNAGGTVIIQNPRTARFPSMPMALPPNAVDFIADLEKISPLLYDLVTDTSMSKSAEKSDEILTEILQKVNDQVNIDFRTYKTSTIMRRINRRMIITNNISLEGYTHYLDLHPEEVRELAAAFLIKVTHFFRDPEAFLYLQKTILPKLIQYGREHNNILRFWSAGCATGEEPYSLALLVADLLGHELNDWNIKIFATDLDEAAISFARRGVYCDSVLRNLPRDYINQYFERVDTMHRIIKPIRQMLIFGQQDLSWSAPFPRIDLIVCRNLLIYFTSELQQRVFNLFGYSLRQDGYLFLGKAETAWPAKSTFELVNKKWKIYICRHSNLTTGQRSDLSNMTHLLVRRRAPLAPMKLVNSQVNVPEAAASIEVVPLRNFNETLLRYLPISVVIIDRSYHILMANGSARRLLGIREPNIDKEQDFLHALRGIPYAKIRAAIDMVFQERSPVTINEVELELALGGDGRFLNFSIMPMSMENDGVDIALITISDVTEQVQIRQRLEKAQVEQAKLLNELSTANRRLNEMNKEFMDANEALQAANEEMMLTQEELQATNEEFETTNEELQATNEELETNNEELQATNEELEATNQELLARSNELQEMAAMVNSERLRLNRLVEMAPFYILVLRGVQLIVETYSPHYARLFKDQNVVGKPLREIFWKPEMADFVNLVQDVYQSNVPQTTGRMVTYVVDEDDKLTENYFVYTIIPTKTGEVDGVIIYAIDVTEQRVKDKEEERDRLKLIIENCVHVALGLYDAQTTQLIQASPLYMDILSRNYKHEHSELVSSKWEDICLPAGHDEGIEYFNKVVKDATPLRWLNYTSKLSGALQNTVWDWGLTPVSSTIRKELVRYVVYWAVDVTVTKLLQPSD
ncbi:MAG: CheR family methyltransferase [Acidobacteriota bacterium]